MAFKPGMTQAELYTYSIVWLLLATLTVFLGQNLQKTTLSRLGFALLFAVIVKAFLIDMSNLEGLYRAVSFIGLGLSLVGIGWLFQKLEGRDSHTNISPERPPQNEHT